MDRQQVLNFLAAMTDEEFDQIADDARGGITAAERRGDWQRSFALKARRLNQLMNPKTEEQN